VALPAISCKIGHQRDPVPGPPVKNRLRDDLVVIDPIVDALVVIDLVVIDLVVIDLVVIDLVVIDPIVDGPMVIDLDGPMVIDLVRVAPMKGVQEEETTQAKIDLVPGLLDIGRQDPGLRVTVLPAIAHRDPFIFRSITPGIGEAIGDGIGGITTKTGGPGRRQAL
jgi:hypothetical protein